MKTVEVKTARPYEVVIGSGLLSEAGERLRRLHPACRAAIVTDDIVDALYAKKAARALSESGYSVCKFVIKNGEASKNAETYLALLNFLSEERLSRSDLVVALGGGVVGDLAGFAAATYLRGIDFIQLPTTLLSAVDSSVGGKTGIDLPAGKNLAGAFWQPRLVLCDCDTLASLPPQTFADGAAEAVKCGILRSEALFFRFEEGDAHAQLEEIIEACVSIKRDVVNEDERDNGSRQLLNLGHTFGHAVEKKSNFSLTHGHAVAIGTVIAANIAVRLGLCDEKTALRIRNVLKRQGLPTETADRAEDLLPLVLSDKKRRRDSLTLILPEQIGACRLYPVKVPEILELLTAGLAGLGGSGDGH